MLFWIWFFFGKYNENQKFCYIGLLGPIRRICHQNLRSIEWKFNPRHQFFSFSWIINNSQLHICFGQYLVSKLLFYKMMFRPNQCTDFHGVCFISKLNKCRTILCSHFKKKFSFFSRLFCILNVAGYDVYWKVCIM